MKITSFNPQIITSDTMPLVEFFKELGFEVRHDQEGIGKLNVEAIRMKDQGGFYVDISHPDFPIPRDMVGIRMNVDDFDEAYKMLTGHGFKNVYIDDVAETRTARSAIMISPTGLAINLVHHIRNHD